MSSPASLNPAGLLIAELKRIGVRYMNGKVLIKNGTVVDHISTYQSDILIENGKIKDIGTFLADRDAEIYDASHMLVLPGIVDPHVQVEVLYGAFPMTDDFDTGTVAAAAGGVTTIIDFADQAHGVPAWQYLQQRRTAADGRVNVDYTLHMSLTDTAVSSVEDMEQIVNSGITSFKLYMTYKKRDRMVNEGQMLDIMAEAARLNAICGIHGENENLVEYMIKKLTDQGKTGLEYFTTARPALNEVIAVNTAIAIAEHTGCTLYVHHCSCAETLRAIRAGRQRGVKIYCETCPCYLNLNEEVFKGENAELYVVNPALRSADDQAVLWEGLRSGDVDTLGTDHCSYTKEQKLQNRGNFSAIPAGHPGVEISLPLMYTTGVVTGKIQMQQLVRLMSYNPARIFGLAPQKGMLRPGSDGDVVIFDPNKKWTMSADKLLMNVDFTTYDGWQMEGCVKATFLRGMKLYENGVFCGPRHAGEYVFGTPSTFMR